MALWSLLGMVVEGPLGKWAEKAGEAKVERAKGKADVARAEADAAAKARILAASMAAEHGRQLDKQALLQLKADIEIQKQQLTDDLERARHLRAKATAEHEFSLREREQKLAIETAEWFIRLLSEVSLAHAEATNKIVADIDVMYGNEITRLQDDYKTRRHEVEGEIERIFGRNIPEALKERLALRAESSLDASVGLISALQSRIDKDVPRLREQVIEQLRLRPDDIIQIMRNAVRQDAALPATTVPQLPGKAGSR